MNRKYDDEFKRQAVKKVFDGQSVASVSRELGVSHVSGGLKIIALFRRASSEQFRLPHSATNLRRRIETVIGELAESFSMKRV